MMMMIMMILPAHMRKDVHITRQLHCRSFNDGLVNVVPNMQKMLLQFTTLF